MLYQPHQDVPLHQEQYEKVIIDSIITSFGLDFLIRDQYGGDVDTIHNVRKIGQDELMGNNVIL